MPTFDALARFLRDYAALTPEQREQFRRARRHLVEDLSAGQGARPGLRVKRVRGTDDVWEMTWAGNGRATWQYGPEVIEGEPHVIWRRIGTHDIFQTP